jgi:hypothetical protein
MFIYHSMKIFTLTIIKKVFYKYVLCKVPLNLVDEHNLQHLHANFFTSYIGNNFLLKNKNWLE